MHKIYTILKGRFFVGLKVILLGVMMITGNKSWSQVTMATFNFESSNLSPNAGAVGSPVLTGSAAVTYNGGSATSPVASGCFAAANNKYFELTISTTGYSSITVDWNARTSSATSSWVVTGDDGTGYGATLATQTLSTSFAAAPTLNLATSFSNKSTIKIKWAAAVSATQTMRIDDIVIRGTLANPAVNLSVSPSTGTEAAGTNLIFTATASAAVSGNQTVDFALTAGSAVAGDFVSIPGTITILSGATTGTATVQVFDDALYECTETGTFTISNPSTGIVLGSTVSQAATITDNDLPVVNLSINTNTGTEAGSTSVTLTATSSAPVIGAQTLALGISGTATAADFTGLPSVITIANGATTGSATFTVNNDALYEGTENATFTISAPSACIALGTTLSQSFSIADDDNPTVSISVSPSSGTEAASTPAVITVTSLAPVTGDQTVTVSLSGTASAADLAGATFPATVTILNGQTTGTLNFNVFDDAVTNEGTETATFTLSSPSSGIGIGIPASANFSIADDDIVPGVAINSINDVATANINTGTVNNIIYHFSTAVTFSAVTLNAVTLPATFTSSADFSSNGFKLWFNASADNFTLTTQIGTGINPTGATLAFTGLSQAIASGTTGYFFITADVASGATVGNTITGNALPLANVTFSTTVTKSGTNSDAGQKTITMLAYTAFDTFDRPASLTTGIPSSGGSTAWTEVESASGNNAPAQIFNNQLMLINTNDVGGAIGNGYVTTSFDMTGKYATIFSNASSDLNWIFNFRSSRSTPSGFTGNFYGMAFIIGSDQADITSATAKGYAVIIGNTGSPDPVKLVKFSAGMTGTLTDVCVSTITSETNYYSVKVVYNPCTSQWSLQVRDDGSTAFADPTTIATTAVTATDATNVSSDLKYVLCEFKYGASAGENCRFDNIYIPSNAAIINTYVWNGATTDYQVATNWTPSRTCPKVNDVLTFTASSPATSTVTNVPSQTIGKLLISGSRAVIFKDMASDGAASTLTIGGGTGTDFSVAAGSSFTFDVAASNATADAVSVSLITGATADISGSVIFRNSNSGTAGRPHSLLAADASAITVNSGALIKAQDLTGDPFGGTGTANVVNFLSGSTYESASGSSPFGLTQPASKVVFNSGSLYRHAQATAFSTSGRVYANFEYNLPSGTTTVLIGNASSSVKIDNLTVTAGTLNITGNTNTLPVNVDLRGNLTVLTGAIFNYDPVVSSTLSFAGIANAQQISNAGTLTFGRNAIVAINNTYATNPRVDVVSDIKIQGMLSVNTGNLHLSTGNITIQSDATSTASVSAVTGTITYGTGLFSVERFINTNRKWRFLAINTITSQSINAAWQEGQAANANSNPGYGAIITDASATVPGVNGFDQSSFTPSMKYFNPAINDYTGVANTSGSIYAHDAYMTFVRGDRTCTPGNALTATTVLRTKGVLRTGDTTYSILNAGDFAAIGNPYASRVSISSLAMTGLQGFIYIWDPKIAGSNSLGGFQTLQKVGSTWQFPISLGGSYPPGINVPMDSIESGQAFFVRASAPGATLTFTELSKAAGSHDVSFTSGQPGSLIAVLKNGAGEGIDGAVVEYDNQNSNSVDFNDALKMANTSENVSIKSSSLLSVEQRRMVNADDTIHINVTGYKLGSYQWTFKLVNMDAPGLTGFVRDNFLNTLLPLNMAGDNNISFTVSSDAGSYAADRFSVVFKPSAVVAVTLSTISAQRQSDKTIKVSWKTESEAGVDRYEIQHSENGTSFSGLGTQSPSNNAGGNAAYAYIDLQPYAGINYYRIKAESVSGEIKYTAVVKVAAVNEKALFSVNPNPVNNKTIHLQAKAQPAGDYKIQIVNNAGQVIYKSALLVSGNTFIKDITLPANTAAGNYKLSVTNTVGKITSLNIVIE